MALTDFNIANKKENFNRQNNQDSSSESSVKNKRVVK